MVAGAGRGVTPQGAAAPLLPFEVRIEDLRARLRMTRWPADTPVDDWSQGVPLRYLQELCAYWAEDYDVRRVEPRYNAWPQAVSRMDGLDVHAVHARSTCAEAVPPVMTAGWP
jgi:hypothetical protein